MTRIHVQIPLRWSDFDAYAHVNNAEMLRLLEEARIQAFWRPDEGAGPGAASQSVTAKATVLDDSCKRQWVYSALESQQ